MLAEFYGLCKYSSPLLPSHLYQFFLMNHSTLYIDVARKKSCNKAFKLPSFSINTKYITLTSKSNKKQKYIICYLLMRFLKAKSATAGEDQPMCGYPAGKATRQLQSTLP